MVKGAKVVTKNKQSRARWDHFFYHILIFICVHLLLVKIVGIIPLAELGAESYKEFLIENFLNQGVNIYENSTVNRISGIWKTVLIIHFIIEIIETLFPSKKKDNGEKIAKTAAKEDKKPTSAWVYLIVAGLLEIAWATALKLDMLFGPFIIVLIISFDLLIKAVKELGVGTAYAVFTGIGAVGIVIVDFIVFQESLSFLKVLLIFLLVVFIIGLKVTGDDSDKEIAK